jgi:hypothetical protein
VIKRCIKCGADLALVDFCKDTRSPDGRCSWCRSCQKKQRDGTSPARKRYAASYRKSNGEQLRLKRRQKYATNPDAAWIAWLKQGYGLSLDRYQALLAAQNGKCANLGCKSETPKRFHVDHNHACCPGRRSCGKCVRGLLCGPCNTAAGLLKDNQEAVAGLGLYLRKATHP